MRGGGAGICRLSRCGEHVEEGATAKEDLALSPMSAAPQEPALPEPAAAAMPAIPPPEPPAQAYERAAPANRLWGALLPGARLAEAVDRGGLKVNVLVRRGGDAADADALACTWIPWTCIRRRACAGFARCAASELHVDEGVIQHDLGRLLLKLEQLIEEQARRRPRHRR